MGVSAAVTAGFGNQSNGTRCIDPAFGGEDKTVQAGLFFNPIEFDGIKPGVVELLPDTEELDGVAVAQPVGDQVVRPFGVLVAGDVGETDKVLLVLGKDGDGCTFDLDGVSLGFAHGSGDELVEGNVVLNVFGNEGAILLRDSFKIAGREDGVGGEVGEVAGLDDVAHLIAGDVGLEVGLERGNGLGFVGFVVGDELGELLFKEFILGFEARDETEDLFENLAQGETTVHVGGLTEFFEGVELGRFGEDFLVHVVDDTVPVAGLDAGGDEVVFLNPSLEPLVEHAVDLHAAFADLFLFDGGKNVGTEMFVAGDGGFLWRLAAGGRFDGRGLGFRELQDLVVIEVLLEEFAVGEEVEELEGGLQRGAE